MKKKKFSLNKVFEKASIPNVTFWILIPILMFALSLVCGLQASLYSDFYPINGDFQNYNVCRRLLDGQIPFRDFVVYLGLGHLYFISFFLKLVGNNFTNSLFIVSALTFACYELLFFTIGTLIFKSKKHGLIFSLCFSVLNIMRPAVLTNNLGGGLELLSAFNCGLYPGNSARMIRGFAPILLLILVYLLYVLATKFKRDISNKKIHTIMFLGFSILSGIMILWSNDYGIASYINTTLFLFLFLLKKVFYQHKKIASIIIPFLCYFIISFCSFFVSICIITRGRVSAWFDFTYGSSQYQQWYFDIVPESKTYFLYQFDFSFFTLLIFILSLVYIYKFLKTTGKDSYRYAGIAYLLLTGFIASNLYRLISGGMAAEVSYLFLMAVVSSELVQLIRKCILCISIRKTAVLVFIVTITFCLYSFFSQLVLRLPINRDGTYVEELNGYMRSFPSLQNTKEKINSNAVFSTYASALEVMTEQFQPSGTDYIIHVLGNKQRSEYLKSFEEGSFQYVTTIREEYSDYEWWIKNSNWFFYRELYKNYAPSFDTEYQTFWEKKDKSTQSKNIQKSPGMVSTKIIQQDNNSYKIAVTTENSHFNGTADLCINYSSKYNAPFYKTLAYKRVVYVEEIIEQKLSNNMFPNFFIPKESQNYYIPITILNGYGEVILTSYPKNCTDLLIVNAIIENIWNQPFSNITLSNVTDANWIDGVNNIQNVLLVDNTPVNEIILQQAVSLQSRNGTVYPINEIEKMDQYIHIKIKTKDNLDMSLSYPNSIQVGY